FASGFVAAIGVSFLQPVYLNRQASRGIHGVILTGCPETYEYSSEQEQQFSGRSGRREGQQFQGDRRGGQQFQDRHQKVENLNEGDVVAIPTGSAHWLHNNGDTELVAVVFFDTQNHENQLDDNHRRFFLAGNPQAQSQQRQPRRQETQHLQIIRPPQTRQQHQYQQDRRGPSRRSGGWSNGVEETICSMKLKENIDNPSHADFVNPEAGRIANLNSFKFPILEHLQLNVERGELRPNAIRSPHWTINAHNLLYITEGNLRVQIVNDQGNNVFDQELREGQVVVIPQNFAVIKRAGEQGSRWVSFKTNDNAMIANLAGRVSAISSMPVDVVANAYQLSREDAQRLKFSQRETVLFSPSFARGQGRASA
ncbi:hypothetical protein M8C21_002638, partial [Ambrosia artemisiifolia]